VTANRVLSPNRVVAVLTPLLFAPLAGALAAWLAEHFPGVEVDPGALEEIFIAGALIALAPAAQWLHGWQKYEARQADLDRELALANAAPPPPVFDDLAEFDEDDALLDSDEELAGEDLDVDLDELDALDEDVDELDDDLLDEDLLDEETAPAGS
jgi:hypothetical protein